MIAQAIMLDDTRQYILQPRDRPSAAAVRCCAHMARTCGLFYEPAMYVLWQEIHSLKPLVCGLDSDMDEGQAAEVCMRASY